jgi:DNA-binding NarL/FixJ family response regulator
LDKLRVLLVDDNATVLRTIWQLLEDEFRVVAAVSDSRCVSKTACEFGVDVIVIDISMPEVDGLELARQLKKEACPAKIVFLTVHRSPRLLKAALSAGGTGYVVKSRAGDDLIPAIYAASNGEAFISPSIQVPAIRNQ